MRTRKSSTRRAGKRPNLTCGLSLSPNREIHAVTIGYPFRIGGEYAAVQGDGGFMKRPSKLIVGMVALLIGTMTAGTAFAWGRSRVFVGFNFGFPGYWGAPYYAPYPYYYPAPVYYPAYYPAPVAVAPAAPPVY